MSRIAGIEDFRGHGPPADMGDFQASTSVVVFKTRFAGTVYVVAMRVSSAPTAVGNVPQIPWTLIDYDVDANAASVIQAGIDDLAANIGDRLVIMASYSRYLINQPLVPKQMIEIAGEGSGLVVLQLSDGANCNLIEYTVSANTNLFSLKNFWLDGNKANNASGTGIYLDRLDAGGINDILIERVAVLEFQDDGIHVRTGWACEFLLVIVENCEGNGADIWGTKSYFSHCYFASNTERGLALVGSRIIIIQTEIYGNGDHGLYLSNVDESLLVGLRIFQNAVDHPNARDGIWYENCEDTLLADSIVDGGTYNGNHYHRYNITILNNNTRLWFDHVIVRNAQTQHVSDDGVDTKWAVKSWLFQWGGDATGIVVGQFIHADASAKGWGVDANAEWAITKGQIQLEVQQVIKLKIWAVALGAPIGAGGHMHLEIIFNAGASLEAFNLAANSWTLTNFDSEEADYAATEIIHWLIEGADVGNELRNLLGGDHFEMKLKHEAGADPDGATNAVFGVLEVEHI